MSAGAGNGSSCREREREREREGEREREFSRAGTARAPHTGLHCRPTPWPRAGCACRRPLPPPPPPVRSGVVSTSVGYANYTGSQAPDYDAVCTGQTVSGGVRGARGGRQGWGAAGLRVQGQSMLSPWLLRPGAWWCWRALLQGAVEVVQVLYDRDAVTFEQLLDVFWEGHDPTTLNRQGGDQGTQYRCGAGDGPPGLATATRERGPTPCALFITRWCRSPQPQHRLSDLPTSPRAPVPPRAGQGVPDAATAPCVLTFAQVRRVRVLPRGAGHRAKEQAGGAEALFLAHRVGDHHAGQVHQRRAL